MKTSTSATSSSSKPFVEQVSGDEPLKKARRSSSKCETIVVGNAFVKQLPIRLPKTDANSSIIVRKGDAFDLLQELPADSVDLLITSPPYWGQRSYGLNHNWDLLALWIAAGNVATNPPPYEWYRKHGGVLGLEPLPDWYAFHLAEILDRAKTCLKAHGNMWINIGDTYFARWASIREKGRQGLGNNPRDRRRTPMGGYRQEKQLLMVPARFAIQMQDRRWILRNDLIWQKPNVPPRPEKDRLRATHEHFFHFVKRPKVGRARYYYDIASVEKKAFDVVSYNVKPGKNGHSAAFPEELIRPRILSSSPPGGVVLDPFCGSGRALIVARKEGRSAIGFDLVAEYVAAVRREITPESDGE